MNLSTLERELIEQALHRLAMAIDGEDAGAEEAMLLYRRAVLLIQQPMPAARPPFPCSVMTVDHIDGPEPRASRFRRWWRL